jgi:charged multivesicular body protein 4
VATAALRRKKQSEAELDRLAGTRLQLENQVNTLESANLNAETMAVMQKATSALKTIHGGLYAHSPFPCHTLDLILVTM